MNRRGLLTGLGIALLPSSDVAVDAAVDASMRAQAAHVVARRRQNAVEVALLEDDAQLREASTPLDVCDDCNGDGGCQS